MPVEIKELSVKAVISPDDQSSSSGYNLSDEQLEHLKKEIKKELMEELKQFITQHKER